MARTGNGWSTCSAAGRRRSASRCAPTGCRRSCWRSSAVVICAVVALFAHATSSASPAGAYEARAPFAFWILLLGGLDGALNTVFLGGDLFTLYVALELLTFAAVPLVCLDGRPETLARGAALPALRAARLGALPGRRPRCSTAPTARSTSSCSSQRVRADPPTLRRRRADDGRACSPRPRSSRCTSGCRRRTPARRRRPARCCRRWW